MAGQVAVERHWRHQTGAKVGSRACRSEHRLLQDPCHVLASPHVKATRRTGRDLDDGVGLLLLSIRDPRRNIAESPFKYRSTTAQWHYAGLFCPALPSRFQNNMDIWHQGQKTLGLSGMINFFQPALFCMMWSRTSAREYP